jgi:hypothetical protein
MAQSLELNIKTTSDVPQAMDKAKQATTGFGKQVDDIGKKFGNSFKDIFLSFLGPMALVTGAIALIGKLIADNQKKQEDANQAAIDGTNKLMSAEDKYWANKRNNEKKDKETTEESKTQRETTTREFLDTDPRGREMVKKHLTYAGADALSIVRSLAKDKGTQEQVQALIAEDMKKNPEVGAAAVKESNFKGPEGFSNVVGVGANPVMEAMNAQLEEQRKQTALLERMANAGFSSADGWMTAPASTAAPSRAALLRGKQ